MKIDNKDLADWKDDDLIVYFSNNRKPWTKFFKELSAVDFAAIRTRLASLGDKVSLDVTTAITTRITLDSPPPVVSKPPTETKVKKTRQASVPLRSELAIKRDAKKKDKQQSRVNSINLVESSDEIGGYGHAVRHTKGDQQAKTRSTGSMSQEGGGFEDVNSAINAVKEEAYRFIRCKQLQYLLGTIGSNESYDSDAKVDDKIAYVYSGDKKEKGPFKIRMVVTRKSLENGSLVTMYPVSMSNTGATNNNASIQTLLVQVEEQYGKMREGASDNKKEISNNNNNKKMTSSDSGDDSESEEDEGPDGLLASRKQLAFKPLSFKPGPSKSASKPRPASKPKFQFDDDPNSDDERSQKSSKPTRQKPLSKGGP